MTKMFYIKNIFKLAIMLMFCSTYPISPSFAMDAPVSEFAIVSGTVAKAVGAEKLGEELTSHGAKLARGEGYGSGAKRCYPGRQYNEVDSCTLCPVFVVVFNTVSKIGSISAEKFSGSIMTVVVVGFAIWLAIEVIKFVASMKNRDLKDFVQALINRSFSFMIVLIILKTGVGNFYNIFIQPVYNTGQNMAQIMFEDKSLSGTHADDRKALKDKSLSEIKEFKNGLPASMGASIVKTMTMMENRIRKIAALGSSLWCQSWKEAFLIIFPKLSYFIFGAVVWILSMSMMVIIPFLLIDAVFQLGVATALMPFAVGAYAFEYTRKKYCRKVFDTFLNSTFSFLFLSVIVLMLLGAIQTSVKSSIGTVSDFDEMFVMGSSAGDVAFTNFKDSVTWGSGFLINLFFVFVLSWSVMNTGKSFAGKFASSISSTSIGSQIGGMMGSAAKGAANKITAPIRNQISKGMGRVARGINHIASRRKTERMAKRFDKKGSDDGNGNRSYTNKKGKKYTIDKDGNITKTNLKSSKISKDGKTKVEVQTKEIRTKNAIVKITTTTKYKMENGQWVVENVKVAEKMKILSESASKIMSKDGKFSPEAMEKLLEGTSGEVRDALRNNALRQITESRFSKAAFDPNKEKLAKPAETTVDKETGEIITKYTTASGEIIISKTKLREDGIVESKLVRTDKKGRVMTFESDGIRNKMTVNLLNEGFNADNFKSKNEFFAEKEAIKREEELKRYLETKFKQEFTAANPGINLNPDFNSSEEYRRWVEEYKAKHPEDNDYAALLQKTEVAKENIKKAREEALQKGIQIEDIEYNLKRDANGNIIGRTSFSYADFYKQQLDAGYIKEKDIPDGMFGPEDIQRDKHGNIVGGEFSRYRKAAGNGVEGEGDKMRWSDFNIRAWGKKNENKRELFSGDILKGGNNYASMEADMNFYFETSSSPKRIKRIFGSIRGF